MSKIKKGNWVEFTMKEVTYQGIVVKGGAKLKIHFGFNGNECRSVSAIPSMFKLIPTPNMDVSDIMTPYSIKAYKEAGGEETTRFEAKLCKNGKVIALVSNDGNGGCNNYQRLDKGSNSDIAEFEAKATEWAKYYGDTDAFESESFWIEWYTKSKPFGLSSSEYWKLNNKMAEDYKNK